ncbi:MAG: hypothetical protein ACKVT1_20230 [Dehalococcoidia bacterium]
MAELKETADQFAKDLIAQNIAGLMMAFTPAGMGKAMAMQAQVQAAGGPPPTGFELGAASEDGAHQVVEIAMQNAGGAGGVIVTRWLPDATGAWKVDDIGLKA